MDKLIEMDDSHDSDSVYRNISIFIEELTNVDDPIKDTVFSDREYNTISSIFSGIFTNIVNEEDQKMFDILSKKRGWSFSSLLCLFSARIDDGLTLKYIECLIGTWLSARYISSFATSVQTYISRAFLLNWPYFRIEDPDYKRICTWTEKHGWRDMPVGQATRFVVGEAISKLVYLSSKIDGFMDRIHDIDEAYGVSWYSTKKAAATPKALKNITMTLDGTFESDFPDVNIDDGTVIKMIKHINNILGNTSNQFTINMFRDKVMYQETRMSLSNIDIDSSSAKTTDNRLRAIRFSNDKLIIFDKSNPTEMTMQKYHMTPGIVDLAISPVRFEYDEECIRLAKEYLYRSYSTRSSTESFWLLVLSIITKENHKKLFSVYAERGDEGKSLALNIISMLGGPPTSIDSSSIYGRSTTTASGHTAHLTDIQYMGAIMINDCPNIPINEGLVKLYTGGDLLYTRAIFGQKLVITIACPLITVSNFIPMCLPGSSCALYKRIFSMSPDVVFVYKKMYRSIASRSCEKCREMYTSAPSTETIHCPHNGLGYMVDVSNGIKYNIRDDHIDVCKIRQGILFLAMSKFNDDGAKYTQNFDDIINSVYQTQQRWKIFLNSYRIRKVFTAFSSDDCMKYTSSVELLYGFMAKNAEFRTALKNEVEDIAKLKSGGWGNYRKALNMFLVGGRNDAEYKAMIVHVIREVIHVSIGKTDMGGESVGK